MLRQIRPYGAKMTADQKTEYKKITPEQEIEEQNEIEFFILQKLYDIYKHR